MEANRIISELRTMFPDAKGELDYETPFQLACAVMLSAQTTDVRVNIVTKELFAKYPDAETMRNAPIKELENIIRSIGLYRNKAKNLNRLSNEVFKRHGGILPDKRKELESLSGIGRKSANVILAECFNVPSIAVDTHVKRVSVRLKLAKPGDSVLEIEKKLQRKIKREDWIDSHHLLIFMGRYKCFSKKPDCTDCPFVSFCREHK